MADSDPLPTLSEHSNLNSVPGSAAAPLAENLPFLGTTEIPQFEWDEVNSWLSQGDQFMRPFDDERRESGNDELSTVNSQASFAATRFSDSTEAVDIGQLSDDAFWNEDNF